MPAPITVDDLVNQVRSQLDEENTYTITDSDILEALNRSQDYAMDVLARQWPEPLLTYTSVTLSNGQAEYDIPENTFEDRLLKIEITVSNQQYELKRIDYRKVSYYESGQNTAIPYYYTIIGRKYRLLPAPTGEYPLRIWYMREPESLVKSQGRITHINTSGAAHYVRLDAIGSNLSTLTTDNTAFVNFIDAETGEVKGSAQIQNIDTDSAQLKVTFKSTPDKPAVYGKTISGELPSDLEVNDYVTLVTGTCVPQVKKPFVNFAIQYAVAELKRKLGDPADMEHRILEKFEQQVERTWVKREHKHRVTKRNKNWVRVRRRRFITER